MASRITNNNNNAEDDDRLARKRLKSRISTAQSRYRQKLRVAKVEEEIDKLSVYIEALEQIIYPLRNPTTHQLQLPQCFTRPTRPFLIEDKQCELREATYTGHSSFLFTRSQISRWVLDISDVATRLQGCASRIETIRGVFLYHLITLSQQQSNSEAAPSLGCRIPVSLLLNSCSSCNDSSTA